LSLEGRGRVATLLFFFSMIADAVILFLLLGWKRTLAREVVSFAKIRYASLLALLPLFY